MLKLAIIVVIFFVYGCIALAAAYLLTHFPYYGDISRGFGLYVIPTAGIVAWLLGIPLRKAAKMRKKSS